MVHHYVSGFSPFLTLSRDYGRDYDCVYEYVYEYVHFHVHDLTRNTYFERLREFRQSIVSSLLYAQITVSFLLLGAI